MLLSDGVHKERLPALLLRRNTALFSFARLFSPRQKTSLPPGAQIQDPQTEQLRFCGVSLAATDETNSVGFIGCGGRPYQVASTVYVTLFFTIFHPPDQTTPGPQNNGFWSPQRSPDSVVIFKHREVPPAAKIVSQQRVPQTLTLTKHCVSVSVHMYPCIYMYICKSGPWLAFGFSSLWLF